MKEGELPKINGKNNQENGNKLPKCEISFLPPKFVWPFQVPKKEI